MRNAGYHVRLRPTAPLPMPARLPACLSLQPHPANPATAVDAVAVSVDLGSDGGLQLRYTLSHDGRLRIPPARPPGPADGLWAHTCCEVFVAVAGDTAYREFNFSPSGQWAVYDFADYRRRAPDTALPPPRVDSHDDGTALHLSATLPATALPAVPRGRLLMLGLSVVSEDTDGALQYWALRHPAPQADFHDRRSFALALAPPAATTREHA